MALTLAACLACGQTAEKPPVFEAASVKPTAGGRPDPIGGPGTNDPGRIHYPNLSLQRLLEIACEVQPFQLAGPGWLDAEKFDIDAVVPAGATEAQFHAMLRNLLAERFQLKMHRESKELSGYALVVAREGPKFHESAEAHGTKDAPEEAPHVQLGKDGFFVPPNRPGLFFQLAGMTGARENFRQSTMQDLAHSLQSQLQRPVTDATGLARPYDFTLTFATEGLYLGRGRMLVNPATLESPPDIFSALRSQLGLRLEPRKIPVEMLVIDHAEKTPTEN